MRRGAIVTLVWVVLGLISAGMRTGAAPSAQASPIGTTVRVPGGSYRSVSPVQLALLLRHKDFVLVNVHAPYAGEIAPTDRFIPFDRIDRHLASLPASRHAMIVRYCRSGRMSEIAARRLVVLGFTNVWHRAGGMDAWRQQGFALLHRPH